MMPFVGGIVNTITAVSQMLTKASVLSISASRIWQQLKIQLDPTTAL